MDTDFGDIRILSVSTTKPGEGNIVGSEGYILWDERVYLD